MSSSNLNKQALAAESNPPLVLIPIDHTYSLPDRLGVDWSDWIWLSWPQVKEPCDEETKVPFSPSPFFPLLFLLHVLLTTDFVSQAYIEKLDIEADIQLLRSNLSIREPCLHIMRFILCCPSSSFFYAVTVCVSCRITGMLLKKGVARGLTLYQIASIICRNHDEEPSELENLCALASRLSNEEKASTHCKRRPSLGLHTLPPLSASPTSASPLSSPLSDSLSPLSLSPTKRFPSPYVLLLFSCVLSVHHLFSYVFASSQ
jgi:hypothetical protein